MHNDESGHYKYVFVCGLQRSGTSVLGRNIARFENCTGFKNTGALMDEGQFLQDVYPIDAKFGGAGRFGFDPRAHRTERSNLLTPENIARLRASWHTHWDPSKSICVEKTPANLLMTRFLQAAFADSYFVVLWRHPVPVSLASKRWKVSVSPIYRLFEHWLHCHELFEKDKKYLKHVYELRYEDYVENPEKYHRDIAAFIGTRIQDQPKEDTYRYVTQWGNPSGLRVPDKGIEKATPVHNQKYLDRWHKLLADSPFRFYYRHLARKYEPEFAKHGYSLMKEFDVNGRGQKTREISAIAGAFCCRVADVCAFTLRSMTRCKGYIRRQIRSRLPQPVKVKIKHLLQRVTLGRKQSEVVSS